MNEFRYKNTLVNFARQIKRSSDSCTKNYCDQAAADELPILKSMSNGVARISENFEF